MFKMLTGRLLNPNYIGVKITTTFETHADHIHPCLVGTVVSSNICLILFLIVSHMPDYPFETPTDHIHPCLVDTVSSPKRSLPTRMSNPSQTYHN